jgi:hypothetical protein
MYLVKTYLLFVKRYVVFRILIVGSEPRRSCSYNSISATVNDILEAGRKMEQDEEPAKPTSGTSRRAQHFRSALSLVCKKGATAWT